MKILLTTLLFITVIQARSQTTHQLVMNGEEFTPDTLYMVQGDSVHLVFDTTGHSLVQVPEGSWNDEVPAPLIGISLGEGTPNVGLEHTFVMDSLGTFYYLCEQHPEEKGLLIVEEGNVGVSEHPHMPGFKLYPVPATDVVHIDTGIAYREVRIDDRQGRPITTLAADPVRGVDVSRLSGGMYFMTLLNEAGEPVARERLIISK